MFSFCFVFMSFFSLLFFVQTGHHPERVYPATRLFPQELTWLPDTSISPFQLAPLHATSDLFHERGGTLGIITEHSALVPPRHRHSFFLLLFFPSTSAPAIQRFHSELQLSCSHFPSLTFFNAEDSEESRQRVIIRNTKLSSCPGTPVRSVCVQEMFYL